MDKYDKIKLENQLCFPLYALSREVIKLYQPILAKFNLTYTQYVIMMVIWEEEIINFKELGKRLHLDSGTLTPVVKKLEAMDLLTKYRTKEDDRVVTVELTDKGRRLKEDILTVPDEIRCKFKGDDKMLYDIKVELDRLLTVMSEQD